MKKDRGAKITAPQNVTLRAVFTLFWRLLCFITRRPIFSVGDARKLAEELEECGAIRCGYRRRDCRRARNRMFLEEWASRKGGLTAWTVARKIAPRIDAMMREHIILRRIDPKTDVKEVFYYHLR